MWHETQTFGRSGVSLVRLSKTTFENTISEEIENMGSQKLEVWRLSPNLEHKREPRGPMALNLCTSCFFTKVNVQTKKFPKFEGLVSKSTQVCVLFT